jgi:arylsulfatase A
VKRDIDRVPQGSTELYDISTDPGETNDVAVSNPEIVKEMEVFAKNAHTPSEIFPFSFETVKSEANP